MTTMFDLINDVSFNKQGLFHQSDDNARLYNKYITELMLSYHPDTILYVNELNQRSGLSTKMHHDYLFYSLPKRKRFAKTTKPIKTEEVQTIQKFFNWSFDKANEVVDLFDEHDFEEMRKMMYRGGKQ